MKLYKITNEAAFDVIPEIAMDTHLAINRAEALYVVVGGRVAFAWNAENGSFDEGLPSIDLEWRKPELRPSQRNEAFTNWLRGLDEISGLEPLHPSSQLLFSLVSPRGRLPPTPMRPASIYGHLQFSTVTQEDTVIYRWEAFPTSKRITRRDIPNANGAFLSSPDWGQIDADTYAAPASEVPFIATGFGAVGRFALPSLLPACFRWELRPEPKTILECGTSVPLYGQAGGGVEVRFPHVTECRSPIADPVVLPSL